MKKQMVSNENLKFTLPLKTIRYALKKEKEMMKKNSMRLNII